MYSNLKLRLWTTGMRQNQLADMVGIDETLLSKIINGHRKPDRELRARIARLLQSSEEWLFEASDPHRLPIDLTGPAEGLPS